ncbi:hypothetical protein Ais01nite_74480 [Asanoa ishikariensis]|uniref:Diguanylate cyclase n=1 Tax=Asanoa ishikariensis TaxID=137265 RepID=A0A1H3UTT1_9ACTN|nr:GGDEF domain-containing protein [Asanoa ishikariensis]GIF69413.1 hypothetical protein Ais01nite_74480 [Asanoa ishikariensis]SDZ65245.1 diguanylate cyclase [Asanoa ishikariensis]
MLDVTTLIAILLACFLLGRLSAHVTIRRLRRHLNNTGWLLSHDSVTGLLNREGLAATYADELADRYTVVALIDLDNFKAVNDTFGHQTGDELLLAVAERIKHVAALLGGVAAHLSGDEFVAIVPADTRGDHVAATLTMMLNEPVALRTSDGHIVEASASVGATSASPTQPLNDALRRADVAMYHAKRLGRGELAFFEPGMMMPPQEGVRRGPRACRR